MTEHKKILNVIRLIRESHPLMKDVFLSGRCMFFFLILRSAFGAKPWYNGDHVLSEIEGRYYDITGQVKDVNNYYPFLEFYGKTQFLKMTKSNTVSNNDPLGIISLQKTIEGLRLKLSELENVALFGEELPVSESRILNLTDIPKGTLLSLRNEGSLRFYKRGKTVYYLPSEFKADLIKAGSIS